MKFVSALGGSRRGGFMPCGLDKSLSLVFYFMENREDEFSSQYFNSLPWCGMFFPRQTVFLMIDCPWRNVMNHTHMVHAISR